jgi:uncharacterized C2H2 Zn-finger protein
MCTRICPNCGGTIYNNMYHHCTRIDNSEYYTLDSGKPEFKKLDKIIDLLEKILEEVKKWAQ